ncbi:LysM peptidoglycan-binding domain-containing protein [Sinomonas sp. JGH33]|uniref:LysM peptidoglycan-binding domain-containing protein n=1 Tax=Sinomonas terricola TaxID=3110330 RepID=A0ABU5TCT8_9MICC|nr:LysM peptidoglycan-binding domain-containing protein [Sinomonas sp. JGH33]MEA5457304.1 LysM peptidoglycan-binding domain-containing protein [Sinomonas sp. JGH33]
MRKLAAGIGALLLLAVLLVGVPLALAILAGNPIPTWDVLVAGVTQPDWSGAFLIGHVLPIVGWTAWAWMAVGILSVIPSTLRRVEPPRLPAFGIGQQAGRALVGAVLAMATVSGGALAATAASAPAAHAAAPASVSAEAVPGTPAPVHAAAAVPSAPEKAAPMVTVKDGDSLWSIAEARLGSGERFREILDLNLGKAQADGHALGRDQFVNSGWVLTLPADAHVDRDKDVEVQAGQTLGSIAKDVYGDQGKAEEIFQASQSIVQPDGTQLGHTGTVRPGDRLIAPNAIPATSAAPAAEIPAAPAPAPAPAPAATAEAPAQAAAAAAPAADAPAQEAPSTSEAAPSEAAHAAPASAVEDSESVFPVTTLWGAGPILAAGVLAVLGMRRMRQQRNRRVGERIAMPVPEIAATELELRAAEDPNGVEEIDLALHWIATWAHENGVDLPKLFAVRLSPSTVEVYLESPARLPEPFEAVSDDDCAWAVDPRVIPAFDPKTTAPYPALVSLGVDPQDGHILVDLEQIGALAITGDEEKTKGALTAIAIELACSKWSEDLLVTLVGFCPELPSAFDTGRVRHYEDLDALLGTLEARTGHDAALLDRLGHAGTQEARVAPGASDTWPPEIVLLSQAPEGDQARRLAELVEKLPRVGLAAVSPGTISGAWGLEIGEDRAATLNPAGIPLTAQIVDEHFYSDIIDDLVTTLNAAVPAEPAPEPVVPVVTTEPGEDEDDELEEAAEAPTLPVAGETPSSPAKLIEMGERAARRRPSRAKVTIDLPDAPFIRILGPVRIENAKGVHPSQVKGASVARITELIAFLALTGPASTEEYDHAIHPNAVVTATKRNPNISRARRWLGEDDGGKKFLPEFADADCYQCPVPTDWSVFCELVGNDAVAASDEALEAALELVTGQPFQGVRTGTRGAWSWSEPLQQEMIAAISDVAYELGARALEDGDAELLLKASTRGVMASPSTEVHRRHKLEAHAMLGDKEGFERTIEALREQCDAMDDLPEVETDELIARLRGHFDKKRAAS